MLSRLPTPFRLAAVFGVLAAVGLLCSSVAPAMAATYGGHIDLEALDEETGAKVPHSNTIVGGERRTLFRATGRILLDMRPVQVATGGRAFVFSDIPTELKGVDLQVEILLRQASEWKRFRSFVRDGTRVGRIATTVVAPEMEADTSVAAIWVQPRRRVNTTVDYAATVKVPSRARLRVAYAFDQVVWDDLHGADVSIVAAVMENGQPTGRRIEVLSATLDPRDAEPGWVEADVDLARLSGREVRFEFRSTVKDDRGSVPPLIAWSVPRIVFPQRGADKPSFVLVSIDGLRVSSLSCCGNERATSPSMDRIFGDAGVVLDNVLAQAVDSTASHMSLMTGLYPSVHGVKSGKNSLGEGVETLASVLSRTGYATAAFTEGGPVSSDFGFARGFDAYFADSSGYIGNPEGTAAGTFERAASWLEAHAGEPVFVFVHTHQVRKPHVPPAPYLEMFVDSRLEADSKLDEGELVRYEREIRYVDDLLGRFVASLDSVNDPRETLLALTSGHGQSFGEHGAAGPGTQLYQESVRVPLMMRGAALRAPERHSELIGLIDVVPTVLELLGQPVPAAAQGKSIADSLRAGLPYDVPPRFSEAYPQPFVTADGKKKAWTPRAYAVEESGHKVIMYEPRGATPRFEAYDLTADPGEQQNLLDNAESLPSWYARLKDLVVDYPTACARIAKPTLDAPFVFYDTRVKLQALEAASRP